MVLAVSLLLVAAAVLAVELPRLRVGPLPEECLAGSGEFWRIRVFAASSALGAGWCTALVTLLRPLRRRTGFYGQIASSLLAALLMTAVPEPLRGPGEGLGWPGCLAVGLGVALISPLFKERGMSSLLWPPVLLGLLLVHGRRETLHTVARARPLRAVQEAVDVAGPRPFLSVSARLPRDQRRALVLGLRQPFFDRDVDLLMVEWDSPEEQWLLRLGGTGLRLDGAQIAIAGPAAQTAPLALLEVQVFPGSAGAWGIAVLPLGADYEVQIVTAIGVLRHRLAGDQAVGTFDAAQRQALHRLLASPLPAGIPVLVLVQSRDRADVFGWSWVEGI